MSYDGIGKLEMGDCWCLCHVHCILKLKESGGANPGEIGAFSEPDVVRAMVRAMVLKE